MTSTDTPVGSDRSLEILRRRLLRKLVGFSSDISEESKREETAFYQPQRILFPVPELVLFALRDVLGWRWYGAWEKVRWTVSGTVEGHRVAFELRKFGFTIYLPKARPDLRSRVEGQLASALRDVEAFLRPFVKAQVERGEMMIVNRFAEFDERYRFHRELADQAYRRGGERPTNPLADPDPHDPASLKAFNVEMNARLNAPIRANREGFFHSTAMIDAYFSCLEHRLILLRAFQGIPFTDGEVTALLSARWDEKLRNILPRPLSQEASEIIGRMRRIKERIRNPFAHGGVENDQGSIFFRLPRVGAIPANLTRFGDSIRFSMLPLSADDHETCCLVFDALDSLLESGTLAAPDQFVKGSVDPVFDGRSVAEYASAIAAGPAEVDAYIDGWSRGWERHVNMDY